MKKSKTWLCAALALIFAAFIGGFCLGRMSGGGDILISADAYASGQSSAALVNINTATAEALQTLPGIGPVIAQRITEYRTAHGDFTSIYGLLEVDGIGQKLLQTIIHRITI